MDKLMEFIKTEKGKKIVYAVAGVIIALLFIKVATPNKVNVFINNGNDCVVSTKSAKKIIKKKKPKKTKKK